ncbi:carbohydrate ABC transporter permease [Paenibacillus andongensis]|uniref:carbohydrate ABC transporter permease n=1 Tax=Paenibacillus andongensis TaxID=2975482 RepID=UPI0021BAA99F|nr:carbohydrate ABC transporter permease [Paenibacillus andongensis]
MVNQTSAIPPKIKINIASLLFYMFLAGFTVFCLYPISFSMLSSFKSNDEIFANPFRLPDSFSFVNYIHAWNAGHIGIYFRNTVFLTAATLIFTALVCLLAAFVLSRFTLKFKGAILLFFVAGLMIPVQSTIIPLAYAFGKFQWNDNYFIMILLFSAFCIPMTIFVLVGFMKSIPTELEEAAVIDGCSHWRILAQIIVPLTMPALATASIFNFIQTWNNLIFPLMFIHKPSLSTVSIGLLSFFGERTNDYGGISAAAVITIIPPIATYIFLQEKVEKGLLAGAVKG